jgi:hypothetical protein
VAVVNTLVDLSRSADQRGLSANLGGDFVVRKTGRGEDRDLLTTSDRVHGVDGRDTSRDHLFGVDLETLGSANSCCEEVSYTRVRVDGATVDVEVVLSEHLGTLVDGLSRSIEDTAQHVLGDTKLQAVASELDFGLLLSDLFLPTTLLLNVPS